MVLGRPAVIVCHCHGVSDRAIRAAVQEGARTCRQVARACHAGRACGGCRPVIHEIIERESRPCEGHATHEPITAAL